MYVNKHILYILESLCSTVHTLYAVPYNVLYICLYLCTRARTGVTLLGFYFVDKKDSYYINGSVDMDIQFLIILASGVKFTCKVHYKTSLMRTTPKLSFFRT